MDTVEKVHPLRWPAQLVVAVASASASMLFGQFHAVWADGGRAVLPHKIGSGRCIWSQGSHYLLNAAPRRAQDMERPLYMQPKDAISYNVCDGIVRPRTSIIDEVKKAEAWCVACPPSACTAHGFAFLVQ